jgi:hypothetical protein
VLYDGLVVPGALLLLGSGSSLIVTTYGGWAFLGMSWLAGMVRYSHSSSSSSPRDDRRAH